jgi:hypothetical protein
MASNGVLASGPIEEYVMSPDEFGEEAALSTMLSEENEEERIILEGMGEGRKFVETPVPEGVFSMFIPWVEEWTTEEMIRKELGECGWGEIVKVDFVFSSHKRKHYKVYVHFKSVPEDVRTHLDGGKHVKVYYNGTYFWKVTKSRYEHKEKVEVKKYELSE